MLKRSILAIVLCVFPLPPSSQGQENGKLVLNLRRCEELALRNNLDLEEARLSLEFSEARRVQAAHANILPKLEFKQVLGTSTRARGVFNEFGVLSSPDSSFKFSNIRYYVAGELNLIQPIYTFGKLSNLERAAEHGVQADQANIEKTRAEVLLKVRELYWTLLLGKELLTVVGNAKSEVAKAQRTIDEALDQGSEDVSQTDLFKLQIFRYEVNKRHREALDRIEIAKSELRMALGLADGLDFGLESEYLDAITARLEGIPAYLEIALQARPEVAQIRSGLRARRALVNLQKSDFYPQLFFGGQVRYNYAKDRFDTRNPYDYNPYNFFRPGVVIGLNMNLNFLQTRDKVRVAQAEYSQLAQKESLLLSGIRLEVQKAYLDAVRAETNMRESRRALRASENWLRSASMTFDMGIGEIKDLLEAFQANSKMKTEHLQNIFEFNTGVAKLSRAVGRDLYQE